MKSETLKHEMGQLAAMFYQLGKASVQPGDHDREASKNEGTALATVSKPISRISKPSPQPILKAV